jgi:hypothetical protein
MKKQFYFYLVIIALLFIPKIAYSCPINDAKLPDDHLLVTSEIEICTGTTDSSPSGNIYITDLVEDNVYILKSTYVYDNSDNKQQYPLEVYYGPIMEQKNKIIILGEIDGIGSGNSLNNPYYLCSYDTKELNYLFRKRDFIDYLKKNEVANNEIINISSYVEINSIGECNIKKTNESEIATVLIDNHKIEAKFRDLNIDNPQFVDIYKAYSSGYISGYSDGTFKPDKPVNRAEFAKMLILAFEKPYQESLSQIPPNLQQFPDLENHWYLPFLSKAVDLKLMQGYPDNTIKPDNTIIQAEAIKMAIIALESTLVTTTEAINTSANWHQPYIDFTLNNLDLSFLTQDSIAKELSRGEAVELIEELLNLP